jgi:putative transposase
VNQELLLRNEYLAAENRILRGHIKGRLLLSEGENAALAEIANRLGRMVLEDVAATAKPDPILGWYRRLMANKFVGSESSEFQISCRRLLWHRLTFISSRISSSTIGFPRGNGVGL